MFGGWVVFLFFLKKGTSVGFYQNLRVVEFVWLLYYLKAKAHKRKKKCSVVNCISHTMNFNNNGSMYKISPKGMITTDVVL